jgi:hypothetical protein
MTEKSKTDAVKFPSLVLFAEGIQNNEPDKAHLTYQVKTFSRAVDNGERIDTRIQAAVRAAGAVSRLMVLQPDDEGVVAASKPLLTAVRGKVAKVTPDKGDPYVEASWAMTDNRTKAQGKGENLTLTSKVNAHPNRQHLEPISIAKQLIEVLNPKVSARSQSRSKVKRLEAKVADLEAEAKAAAELEELLDSVISQLPDDARAKAAEIRKAARERHAEKQAA